MKKITELLEDWAIAKAKLKQRFAALTDNDLQLIQGKQEELLTKLQIKLGKTKEQIQKILADL